MRSCRGREWGHGVRRLSWGGAGSPGGQSRGRRNMNRKEQGQGCGGPGSWQLSRECGDRDTRGQRQAEFELWKGASGRGLMI